MTRVVLHQVSRAGSIDVGPRRPDRLTWLVACLVGCLLVLLPSHAQAQATPQAEPGLRSVIVPAAKESRRYRLWSASVELSLSAVEITAGSFIAARGSGNSSLIFFVDGGVRLLSSGYDLIAQRSSFEKLRLELDARGAVDKPRVERAWYELAKKARGARIRRGVLATVAGGVLAGLGGIAAISDADIPANATRAQRAQFQQLLLAFGAVNFADGIRMLIVADPIETSWRTYRAVQGAKLSWRNVNVAPIAGGAMASLHFDF